MRWVARFFLALLILAVLMAIVWTIRGGVFGLVLGLFVIAIFAIPYSIINGRITSKQEKQRRDELYSKPIPPARTPTTE